MSVSRMNRHIYIYTHPDRMCVFNQNGLTFLKERETPDNQMQHIDVDIDRRQQLKEKKTKTERERQSAREGSRKSICEKKKSFCSLFSSFSFLPFGFGLSTCSAVLDLSLIILLLRLLSAAHKSAKTIGTLGILASLRFQIYYLHFAGCASNFLIVIWVEQDEKSVLFFLLLLARSKQLHCSNDDDEEIVQGDSSGSFLSSSSSCSLIIKPIDNAKSN